MPAVPPAPSTSTGSQRCFARSTALAQLQPGMAANSGENSPSMFTPNQRFARYIRTSARRKDGTDMPRKPTSVNA